MTWADLLAALRGLQTPFAILEMSVVYDADACGFNPSPEDCIVERAVVELVKR